jgi:hypothetical protein
MKFDVFNTVFEGLMWAIVLVWLAFVGSRAGWGSLGLAGLPILCAYYLGAERGYRKWKRLYKDSEL